MCIHILKNTHIFIPIFFTSTLWPFISTLVQLTTFGLYIFWGILIRCIKAASKTFLTSWLVIPHKNSIFVLSENSMCLTLLILALKCISLISSHVSNGISPVQKCWKKKEAKLKTQIKKLKREVGSLREQLAGTFLFSLKKTCSPQSIPNAIIKISSVFLSNGNAKLSTWNSDCPLFPLDIYPNCSDVHIHRTYTECLTIDTGL